jgi:dipeptidyl aminopeptidase/acylaminoacyl peptidase
VTLALLGLLVACGRGPHGRGEGRMPPGGEPAASTATSTAASLADGVIIDQHPVSSEGKCSVSGMHYASDGLAIGGATVIPDGKGPYPVIVWNHPRGGTALWDPAFLTMLCNAGPYVVLASDLRGEGDSEGQPDVSGTEIDDILNLIKVASNLPSADPSRVGMVGFSRGGERTYAAIERGAPVKAAIAVSSGTDLAVTWNDADERSRRQIELAMGGDPQQKPDVYRDRSPIHGCAKVAVPVLILHGDADAIVPVSEARAMEDALEKVGATSKLVVVPGGGHMLRNVPEQRDQEILAWFARYL